MSITVLCKFTCCYASNALLDPISDKTLIYIMSIVMITTSMPSKVPTGRNKAKENEENKTKRKKKKILNFTCLILACHANKSNQYIKKGDG